MEDNESRRSELEMDGLSLIDVSSEDDCLLFANFSDDTSDIFPDNGINDNAPGFLGNVQDHNEEISFSSFEEKEQILKPHASRELEKARKGGKCNLRKSLAWDNAFFTSAGVLDAEEISSIIESNQKSEKQTLGTIQEDPRNSTESVSTLQSDSLTGETFEPDLSEDIRASMQRSSKPSDTKATNSSQESGMTGNATTPSPSKVACVSHDKIKPRGNPKKVILVTQGLGKTAKPISQCPPVRQSATTRAALNASTLKPPKALRKVSPMPITSTKRASLDVNRVKLQKDSKSATGKLVPAPKASAFGGAKSIVPRPVPLPRSSLRSSSANKTDLTSSCSSLESCSSASSGSSHRSSSNSVKKNNDPRMRSVNSASLGSTARVPRVASRNVNQTKNSHLSAREMSKAKLSANTLPSSSISECSSESSSTSTFSENVDRSKAIQKTSSCTSSPAQDDNPINEHSQNSSTDQSSALNDGCTKESEGERAKRVSIANGGLAHTTSVKPSGLRMPSPKIGFFDGVRSVARTPTGNVQPRSGLGVGLPRLGNHSPSGSSTSARSLKAQLARSPLQGTSNLATKGTNTSQSAANAPGFSPKARNRLSARSSEGKKLKAEVGSKLGDGELKEPNLDIAEKSNSSLKKKGRTEKKSAEANDIKVTQVLENSGDNDTASADENANPSMELGEDRGEKTEVSIEDQVNKSTKESTDPALTCEQEEQRSPTPTNPSLASSPIAFDGIVSKKTPLAVNNLCGVGDDNSNVPAELTEAEVELADSLCSVDNVLAGYS